MSLRNLDTDPRVDQSLLLGWNDHLISHEKIITSCSLCRTHWQLGFGVDRLDLEIFERLKMWANTEGVHLEALHVICRDLLLALFLLIITRVILLTAARSILILAVAAGVLL